MTVTRQEPPAARRATRPSGASLARGAAALAGAGGGNGANGRAVPAGTAGEAGGVAADARVPAAAAAGGSAILRGGPPPPPTSRPMRASRGPGRPRLAPMGLTGDGTTDDELWELGAAMRSRSTSATWPTSKLGAKAAEVGEADWKTVERLVLIRTIDSLWVEHLTELDDMRRGIGLRGYAQQDPLNEFQREAFPLYDELRGLIRHGVATLDLPGDRTRQPAPGRAAIRRWPPRSPRGGGTGAHRRERSQRSRPERPARPARPVASRPMRRSRQRPRSVGPPSCAAARRRHPTSRPMRASLGDRAGHRRRAAAGGRGQAARSPGSPRAASGSGATIRAGAAPARSTRSVTGAEPGAARSPEPST